MFREREKKPSTFDSDNDLPHSIFCVTCIQSTFMTLFTHPTMMLERLLSLETRRDYVHFEDQLLMLGWRLSAMKGTSPDQRAKSFLSLLPLPNDIRIQSRTDKKLIWMEERKRNCIEKQMKFISPVVTKTINLKLGRIDLNYRKTARKIDFFHLILIRKFRESLTINFDKLFHTWAKTRRKRLTVGALFSFDTDTFFVWAIW